MSYIYVKKTSTPTLRNFPFDSCTRIFFQTDIVNVTLSSKDISLKCAMNIYRRLPKKSNKFHTEPQHVCLILSVYFLTYPSSETNLFPRQTSQSAMQ